MAGRKHVEFYAVSPKAFGDRIKAPESDKESAIFRAAKGQEFLHQLSKQFVDGIAAIQARYKPDAQAEEVSKLAGSLLAQIPAAAERFLVLVASTYDKLKGQLFTLTSMPFADTTLHVRRAELRGHLRNLKMEERIDAFNRAIESGQTEIVNAFLDNSEFFGLLGTDIIAAGKKKWLLKNNPTLGQEFYGTERAGSILSENFQHVIEDLAAYATVAPAAFQKMLGDIPKPGWNHTKSGDAEVIDSGTMASQLPPPSHNPVQTVIERLENKK